MMSILKYKILFIRFITKIIMKISPLISLKRCMNDYYHHLVLAYLQPYLSRACKLSLRQGHINKKTNSGIIWIFWWQGYKNMPIIVKKCYKSVLKYANHHKVILITKDNIRQYSTIPEYIYNKVNSHSITLTHLSDILRFNLLYNYGGLWIDSTIYCNNLFTKSYFTNLYTARSKDTDIYHLFVSNNRWTGFVIGGCKYNILFNFMNLFFQLYWKYHDYMIDYFIIDFALYYAYIHNIGDFKVYDNNIACNNNPNLYELVKHLNDHFNLKDYKKMSVNTNLFKLTYKCHFNDKKGTFFNKLLNDKL